MINKIETINNLAVFKGFEWDKSVIDNSKDVSEFKFINIFYGRNYSGKTTLSRIFRAMETGELSDKYENPEFCVSMKSHGDVTQNNLKEHNEKIRVFNEDFVKENLRFISDPNGSIESFAILGTKNNFLEQEIESLKSQLGTNEEGKETRLYAKLKEVEAKLLEAKKNHQTAQTTLNNEIDKKATNIEFGIKYKSERFGDQNYDKRKLNDDIKKVLKNNFEVITNEKQKKLDELLEEKAIAATSYSLKINLQFSDFLEQTKQLLEKEIGASNKIAELIKDVQLSKWVKDGVRLHKDKRKNCAFCNNEIEENRWVELDKHFDEESKKLEDDIDCLIKKIENEKEKVINGFNKLDKGDFYSKFHSELCSLRKKYNNESAKYNDALGVLNDQLKSRKDNLIEPKIFQKPDSFEIELTAIWGDFESICNDSNNFTNLLNGRQAEAKKSLRLREVYDFVKTINYTRKCEIIKEFKKKEDSINAEKDELNSEINNKINLIETKEKSAKDERKGAEKVNEYLDGFFGHRFLSLEAVESGDENGEDPKFKFEIMRDGKKAYHLSGGENNLIAFCYFMAKLENVETKDKKPIIWIDDPVSSLDGNHIFFVYSIIQDRVIDTGNFEQLFISTHSLEFLKYLKRFSHRNYKDVNYFIVNRLGESSIIELMPEHLKKYITEFNYLFNQIYDCSPMTNVDNNNYYTFYNFGNNARKFLEVFLYYKYPDSSSSTDKLKKFFAGETIPAILTDRINNEYSHLGSLERGAIPIEVPEIESTAGLILKRMEETDKDQYDSLLKSIGKIP